MEPSRNLWERGIWSLVCATLIALALCIALGRCIVAGAAAPVTEMGLIYDRARWPEAARIARRHGLIVANIDSGRGTNATERQQWDTMAGTWRSLGGVTIGYVDYLDPSSRRKADADILAECRGWLKAGYTGVFLDDARDTAADAKVIKGLRAEFPSILIIANPGTRCTGPLKATAALLCESEKAGTINFASRVIIAFVKDAATATAVRAQAAKASVRYLATEPLATYHKAGVEYQKINPLNP